MSPDGLIAVSPHHTVRLAPEYHHLVSRPPGNDFVVRTLAHRSAGGMPLMAAELVIAGGETRAKYPLTETYPLHFRKTYFPASLHGDPQVEFERQSRASELLPVPPPLGWSPLTFRSCFLPGKPYNRISPFGLDPEEANIQVALELDIATAAGLWHLLSQAFSHLTTLHASGFVHGDMELHNLITCPSPLEVHLIDFENARNKHELSEAQWEASCAKDLLLILKEAAYLECRLGEQTGAMADAVRRRFKTLFNTPGRFERAIQRQAGL
jgi:hypothetical protein